MSYPLIFTESYSRRATRFLKKHPELFGVYAKTLRLLELNPNHPTLRLHKLQGRRHQIYSVSVTYAYRITLSFAIMQGSVVLIDIVTHDDAYD